MEEVCWWQQLRRVAYLELSWCAAMISQLRIGSSELDADNLLMDQLLRWCLGVQQPMSAIDGMGACLRVKARPVAGHDMIEQLLHASYSARCPTATCKRSRFEAHSSLVT